LKTHKNAKAQEADALDTRRWKFMALSQGQARQRTFNDNYLLISVQDPDEPLIELPQPPQCRGILRLHANIESRRNGMTLFSREQAHQILDFVREHRGEAATIACHCKMGMCRSPAITAALAAIMGQETKFLSDNRGRPKYRLNRSVYETLLQEGRRHPLSESF